MRNALPILAVCALVLGPGGAWAKDHKGGGHGPKPPGHAKQMAKAEKRESKAFEHREKREDKIEKRRMKAFEHARKRPRPVGTTFTTPPMRFRGLDRNHDGIITRNEWRGSDRSFRVHDWNGDGVLSGIEVRPGARRPR